MNQLAISVNNKIKEVINKNHADKIVFVDYSRADSVNLLSLSPNPVDQDCFFTIAEQPMSKRATLAMAPKTAGAIQNSREPPRTYPRNHSKDPSQYDLRKP
jgi:hypothetical protein